MDRQAYKAHLQDIRAVVVLHRARFHVANIVDAEFNGNVREEAWHILCDLKAELQRKVIRSEQFGPSSVEHMLELMRIHGI